MTQTKLPPENPGRFKQTDTSVLGVWSPSQLQWAWPLVLCQLPLHLRIAFKVAHRGGGVGGQTSSPTACAAETAAQRVIESGQLLIEAKKRCPHGQWLAFLKEAGVNERSAQRLM
jgi:Protein of unknown function (DUF3102)